MRRLLAAAAVLTLTACINDSIGIVGTQVSGGGDVPSSTSVLGTYTLRTVDAQPLPFTFLQTATEQDEVIDDAFTLTNENSWTRIEHIRQTINGTVSTFPGSDAGTYSKIDVDTYRFIPQTLPPFTATIANGVLTASRRNAAGQSVPSVYSK